MSTDSDPTIVAGSPAAQEPPAQGAGARPAEPGTSDGSTWIADGIAAKVAASAAREVDGVEDLRGTHPRRGWVRASERRRGGASVRVEGDRAEIELRLVVRDGVAIPRVVDEVRARVIHRVEFATGLTVTKVDVGVVDVVPAPSPPADAVADGGGPADSGAEAEGPPSPS